MPDSSSNLTSSRSHSHHDGPINLTFIAFGRVRDGTLLGLYSHDSARAEKSHTTETFNKILHAAKVRLRPGGRQKLMWGNQTVSIMVNHPAGDLLYGVVSTCPNYPERLQYQLLNELADEVESTMSSEKIDSAPTLSLNHSVDLSKLLDKYQDWHSIDRLAAIQAKTDNLNSIMQKNIRDIMLTTEQVDVLENDTERMESAAQEYKKGASDLKDYFWWKDAKMQLMIGAVGFFLLLWVVWTIGSRLVGSGGGTSGTIPVQGQQVQYQQQQPAAGQQGQQPGQYGYGNNVRPTVTGTGYAADYRPQGSSVNRSPEGQPILL